MASFAWGTTPPAPSKSARRSRSRGQRDPALPPAPDTPPPALERPATEGTRGGVAGTMAGEAEALVGAEARVKSDSFKADDEDASVCTQASVFPSISANDTPSCRVRDSRLSYDSNHDPIVHLHTLPSRIHARSELNVAHNNNQPRQRRQHQRHCALQLTALESASAQSDTVPSSSSSPLSPSTSSAPPAVGADAARR